MNSVITTVVGLLAILMAMFCTFGAGIEISGKGRDGAAAALFFAFIFTLIGVALLLVRS